MNKKKLKQNYETTCNAYLKEFCLKHDYYYDPMSWIGRGVGTIIEVSDLLFIGMEDIRTDIDTDAPEDEFVKWYDYSLRLNSLGCKGIPNYENWLRKCPIKSEEEILAIEAAQKRIDDLKNEFEKMCQEDYKDSKKSCVTE